MTDEREGSGPGRSRYLGATVRDIDDDAIGEVLARIRDGSAAHISGLREETVALVVRMLTEQATASGITLSITRTGDITTVRVDRSAYEGLARRYAA